MRYLLRNVHKDLQALRSFAELPKALGELFRLRRNSLIAEYVSPHFENIDKIVRDNALFSQIHYSGVIINLYGLVEFFVEELLTGTVDALGTLSPTWSDVPDSVREKHTPLSLELMKNINSGRACSQISLQDVAQNLNFCLRELDGFELNARAYASHTANFRHGTVVECLNRLGIQCGGLLVHFSGALEEKDIDAPTEWLSPVVDELANRRNLVAHGRVDDLLSPDLMVVMIDLVSIYLTTLMDFSLDLLARHAIRVGAAVDIGRAKGVWHSGTVVGFDPALCKLRVADFVSVVPEGGLAVNMRINSLRQGETDVNVVNAGEPCGVGLGRRVSSRSRFWLLPSDLGFW